MSLYSSLTQVLAPFAAKINGLLTGWDGTEYTTPGEAVRQQISDLHVLIGDVPGVGVSGSAVSYDGTESGLSATNVQAAIDENAANVSSTNERLDNVEGLVLGAPDMIQLTATADFSAWKEKKTIDYKGSVTTNSDTIYCDAYLLVEDYAIDGSICFLDNTENNGYFVAIAFYDSSKSFLSRAGHVSGARNLQLTIPDNAVYFRIVLVYKVDGTAVQGLVANHHLDQLFIKKEVEVQGLVLDVADLKSTMDEIEGGTEYVTGGDVTNYDTINGLSWQEKHSIGNNGTISTNNDVMYCADFLEVNKYAIDGEIRFADKTYNNGFFIGCAFYTAPRVGDDVWVSRYGYVSGNRNMSVPVPSGAVYFRIVLVYKIDNSAVIATMDNVPLDQLFIGYADNNYQGLVFDLSQMRGAYRGRPSLMDIPPVFISSTMKTPGQGLTKIDDYFVKSLAGSDSYDSAGSTAQIKLYNSSFAEIGHMLHNLGHGSGICYNQTFDAFLMGNGNSDIAPRLDILLGATASVESAVNENEPEYFFGGDNVLSIYLTKNGEELLAGADGATWCTAGNDRLVFISLRRSLDKARVFYLAMLGVGSEDFSLLDNGYGTFVNGKSDSELNGTIKILKYYEPISETIASAQGMMYDKGRLIVSSSKTNCLFYVIEFFERGYSITRNLKCTFFNADGTEQSCEPEGVVGVGDGHFYCATTKGVIEFYA